MTGRSTLAAEATFREDIRKSVFVATAVHAADPAQATAFIARVSAADATHHCWAWRIGSAYRSNDDGEPGGSAGRPILAAIEGQSLDQVAVVVTRWYGGIKLGVGGLMRAYGGCAAQCLRAAEKCLLVEHVRVHVACDYAIAPLLHARLRAFDARSIREEVDAPGMRLAIDVPRDRLDALVAYVADLSRGRATTTVAD